jgi:integrase/recombinase XerD
MPAHQKLILDKRRPKKNGLYPVKTRITYQRLQKYYNIGVDLSEIDFERIIKDSTRKELRSVKKKISLYQSKVRNVIDSLEKFTFQDFESKFLEKKEEPASIQKEVFNYFEEVIDQLTKEGRIGTANAYKGAYNSLKNFMPDLTFHMVKVDFLKEYE